MQRKIEIELLTELDSEHLERLEDELKEFLAEKGLEAKILNRATGNELTVHPIPKCPKCGSPLTSIIVEEFGNTLFFNDKTGVYEYDDEAQVSQTYRCPECETVIGGYKSNGDKWGFVPEVA